MTHVNNTSNDQGTYKCVSKTIELNTVNVENHRTMIQLLNGIFFFSEEWMNEEENIEEGIALEQVSI